MLSLSSAYRSNSESLSRYFTMRLSIFRFSLWPCALLLFNPFAT